MNVTNSQYMDARNEVDKMNINVAKTLYENGQYQLPNSYEDLIFYVTITFKPINKDNLKTINIGYSNSFIIESLNHFYKQLCSDLLGKNWRRMISFQPFVIYSVDKEGSKTGYINEDKKCNNHIHSIFIVHPDILEKWKKINWKQYEQFIYEVYSIKVTPFDKNIATYSDLRSYNEKAKEYKYHQNYDIMPRNFLKYIKCISTYNTSIGSDFAKTNLKKYLDPS